MKKLGFLILIVGLGALTGGIARVSMAAPPAQGQNLLQNPGFEQPFSGGVAQGWIGWNKATEKQDDACLVAYHYQPKWNLETTGTFVREGASSQYVGNNWDTWGGGVFQTVPATPGTTYRFTFYGRGRGTSEPSPAPSESGLNMNMRAGIDPNGSGNWADGDVVWSGAGSPHDTWQAFTVEAVATGNQLTVFTSADWGVTGVNQCRQFLDTWYDSAALVAATPPPTDTPPPQPTLPPATATTPPLPTNTPEAIPTEAAAATIVATLTSAPVASPTPAGSATICVNAFLDDNGNGLHEPTEGYVNGITLTVAQGFQIVGQGVSTGTETPVCFSGLFAGEYQVAQTVPPQLEPTTQVNATVQVAEGQTIGLEFGSRLRVTATAAPEAATSEPAPTATAAGDAGDGGGIDWLVIVGLLAIGAGLLLLGILIFVLLRR